MRQIIREIKKDLESTDVIGIFCSVSSCDAVLKKNESGLCAGCARVIDNMDDPSNAWIGRGAG
jgi:hypothetical protein